MAYLPWIEKYRPKKMCDIISHDQNIETIKKLLLNNALPHLLFHGSSGTGKTSTIMTLANEIYSNNIRLMVMKLDASDDRGINSVREDIKGFAEKSNMFIKGIRLIILDEADSMTFDAQFALRRIIEKYSSTIRFCLICNYENKIIPAIRSRCANFRFSNIDPYHIKIKLKQICDLEKLSYDNGLIDTIAYLSNGDLRKAINILQTNAMQYNYLTIDTCYEIVGIPRASSVRKLFARGVFGVEVKARHLSSARAGGRLQRAAVNLVLGNFVVIEFFEVLRRFQKFVNLTLHSEDIAQFPRTVDSRYNDFLGDRFLNFSMYKRFSI